MSVQKTFLYTMENNRVVGSTWTYDADGRVLTSGLPDEYSTVAYDAAGRIITTTTERTANRYYDGDGREAKRWLSYWNESDPQNPHSVSEVTYYIRSSVLGGAVVSEADWKGRKEKTFVTAAGAQVAWQAASYDQAGNQTGEVFWNHTDASGSTYRATNKDGAQLAGEGVDGSPAEFDPMGGNVGLYNPYYELTQLPPEPQPHSPVLQPFGEESPMSVGGVRMSATLDGMAIPMSIARQLMESGAAAMEFRIGTQVFQAPITSYGAGIFTVSIPRQIGWNVTYDGANDTRGTAVPVYSGTNTYSFSMPWNVGWQPRQLQNPAAQTNQPQRNLKDFPCPPTADQLRNKFHQVAKDLLFNDSGHRTLNRRENGGWIYQKRNGEVFFVKAEESRRGSTWIDLNNAPSLEDGRVIGNIHTHPYPENEQNLYNRDKVGDTDLSAYHSTGPSWRDERLAFERGVPSLVAYEGAGIENPDIAGFWFMWVGPGRAGRNPERAQSSNGGYLGNSLDTRACDKRRR